MTILNYLPHTEGCFLIEVSIADPSAEPIGQSADHSEFDPALLETLVVVAKLKAEAHHRRR